MARISNRHLKQFTWHKICSQANRNSFNMLECLPNDKEKIKMWFKNKKTKLSKEKIFIFMAHCEKYLTIRKPYSTIILSIT